MNVLSTFLHEHTVAALALLCIPISGVFLVLQRDKLKLDTGWKLALAPFVYVIVGLMSLAVFSILHDIRSFPHWSIHHQGLMIVFPLFFPLVGKLLKVDWLDVSDALTVSIPGIIAVLRIFCLVRGCCFGKPFFGTEYLWPVRELAMLLNFGCCVVFLLWNRREHIKGIILPVYWVFYGVYRTAEILLRSEYYSLTNAEDYFFAILSLLAGVFCLLWLDEKNRRHRGRKKHG